MEGRLEGTPRPRRFTREEYERMVEAGVLGPGDHVELLEGEILVMSPEKSRHAATIDLVGEALRKAFGARYTVRIQHPLALGAHSEPEPDVAVVLGSPRDYADAHPRTAALVVEVAEASLAYDRSKKAQLYAQAGLPEYWIVDLAGRCVERYRDPGAKGYASITRHASEDAPLVPLAAPGSPVPVGDLLL